MKKLLSAIAGAGIMAVATLASAPAQAQFVGNSSSATNDLISVLDGIDSLDDLNFGDHDIGDFSFSANFEQLTSDLPSLLANPEELENYYNSNYAGGGSGFDPNGWIISKGGCSVDVGCVIPKIGIPTALSCYSKAGLDPDELANCLQETDPQKYQAAVACTFGDCPAFAALPAQLVATSTCQYQNNATLADNLLLDAPTSFEPKTTQTLQVDWLSKG